jgi:hypothetical protein
LEEIQKRSPDLISTLVQQHIDTGMSTVDRLLEEHVRPTIKTVSKDRMNPELFVPGQLIHLYRNGLGVSARKVPTTFFDELDIKLTMIRDHIQQSGYAELLAQLRTQRGNDPMDSDY